MLPCEIDLRDQKPSPLRRRARLPDAQEIDGEPELAVLAVAVDVPGRDRPAVEVDIELPAGLRRPTARDVPGTAHLRVHEPRQPRRPARLYEAKALLLVESRPDVRGEIAEDRDDLRVGVPEPQVVDIVPGIGSEAEVLVRLEDSLGHEILERRAAREEVESLAEGHPRQLPAHRLLVGPRRGFRGETVRQRVRHLVGLVDGVDARSRLVARVDAARRAPARLPLRVGLLVDTADLDEVGARLDDVLERGDAAGAVEGEDARGPRLDEHAALDLLSQPVGVPGLLDAHRFALDGRSGRLVLSHHFLVVVGQAAAGVGRHREEPCHRHGQVEARVKVGADSRGADLADEVHEGRLPLVEQARHARHGLAQARQLDLRRPLELDRAGLRQVLVPVDAADQVERVPALGDEDVRLGDLPDPVGGRRRRRSCRCCRRT